MYGSQVGGDAGFTSLLVNPGPLPAPGDCDGDGDGDGDGISGTTISLSLGILPVLGNMQALHHYW
jgi:hypothetical protein